jgi:hypothetical protein
MTHYQVTPGEELWVEPLGIPNASPVKGSIAEVSDNGFALSLPEMGNPFPSGALLFLRPANKEDIVGWGLAKDFRHDGHQARVFIQSPVWETPPERRARRVPGPYWAHVSYLSSSGGHHGARKTVGQLINLSISGVRVRLRNSVKVGEPVMLKVYIGEDRSFEAIGRVVRVVPGAETSSGGFDVGVCFVRILRGYPELLEAVGAETPSPEASEGECQEAPREEPAGSEEEETGPEAEPAEESAA